MKQHQGSGADKAKTANARQQTGAASAAPHEEDKAPAGQADERRLQKATGDVREILRNARHH
jgi:hypothetical protein